MNSEEINRPFQRSFLSSFDKGKKYDKGSGSGKLSFPSSSSRSLDLRHPLRDIRTRTNILLILKNTTKCLRNWPQFPKMLLLVQYKNKAKGFYASVTVKDSKAKNTKLRPN